MMADTLAELGRQARAVLGDRNALFSRFQPASPAGRASKKPRATRAEKARRAMGPLLGMIDAARRHGG